MTTATFAGYRVSSFWLSRPRVGVWLLEAEIDLGEDEPPAAGPASLVVVLEDGTEQVWRCTMPEAVRARSGRGRVFAVGGAGGWRSPAQSLDYDTVRPRLVVEDLLRLSGEQTTGADLDPLGQLDALPRWSLLESALERGVTWGRVLTRLTDRLGLSWRVRSDGTLRVTAETWPVYGGEVVWIEEVDDNGVGVVALDGPDLEPGQTLPAPVTTQRPVRVDSIVYTLSESGVFRARVREARDGATRGRLREQWEQAVLGALPPLGLSRTWPATVIEQASDGTLGVRLDAGAPVLVLSGVPIWLGLPGVRIEVEPGARVLVGFLGGREDAPFAGLWETDAAFVRIVFEGGALPIARKTDPIRAGTLRFTTGPAFPGPTSIMITHLDADGVPTGVPILVTPGAPDPNSPPPPAPPKPWEQDVELPGVIVDGKSNILA